MHLPTGPVTLREVRLGRYELTVVKENDSVCDVPIPAIFPQLDQNFPGSKFVYTFRDVDSWIESHKKVSFNRKIAKPGSGREYYRAILYGITAFDESRFRWVHRDHHRRVMDYFSGSRAQDCLVLNITAGEGWEKLCPFLERDIIEEPFPRRNKSVAVIKGISEAKFPVAIAL